jgi:hypothetical protein
MSDAQPTSETVSTDPCEKCGSPVYGYVEQRCCDGRECGCMGLPLSPCWCPKCWEQWQAESEARAAEITCRWQS